MAMRAAGKKIAQEGKQYLDFGGLSDSVVSVGGVVVEGWRHGEKRLI